MKQLLQFVRDGRSDIVDIPSPICGKNKVLVQTATSLVSAGTERMIVDFAEKNLIEKARSRPDLVRQTIDKAQREGILTTYDAVQNRLEQPMALGYSCAGVVLEVGSGIKNFKVGDRVACAGAGYAVHAETIAVPENLVVPLPENVDFESASFTTLAAIALQGIRLADVKLGDVVGVIGLGLLGQLTIQMLQAAGCIVLGMDIREDRVELALKMGAHAAVSSGEAFESICQQYSDGHGVDSVQITADTKSNQPVELAGTIARKKGTVVAVGAVGMNIPRKTYYDKEVSFHISSSYGPGRYDSTYEEKGIDYPYAYVRWTENRNMRAFIQMVANKQLDIQSLITHRYSIEEADTAYELITGKLNESFLGVVLTYPEKEASASTVSLASNSSHLSKVSPVAAVNLGMIGAGNFATATILPALKTIDTVNLIGIASGRGVTARSAGDRFGFNYCSSDYKELLSDENINAVAILTRHDAHARQVIEAIQAKKHAFVEKPLCLNQADLDLISDAIQEAQAEGFNPQLMVGLNRRFAPMIVKLKEHLDPIQEPLMLNYRVNAGFIPKDHWTQDVAVGGGRLLGEGIHFIDLIMFLANETPVLVNAYQLPDVGRYSQDNLHITMQFANGTIGNVTYVANGDKAFSKEMVEAFGGGLSARMDDYRRLQIRHGKTRVNEVSRLRQDKGHKAEWESFSKSIIQPESKAGMSFQSILFAHQVAFAASRSLTEGRPIHFSVSEADQE
ncbi:MAG: bi-domain-containing oxidoreductase [Anaerolineae bacterium]